MFESALGRSEAARGRLGTGAILSLGVHALVVAAVLVFTGKKAPDREEASTAPIVVLVPPPLLGTPGGPAKQDTTKPKRPPKNPKIVPILTKEPPPTEPTEPDPAPDSSSDGPAEQEGPGNGGQPDGDPKGVVDGKGPVPPPPPPEPPKHENYRWESEMGLPMLISGPAQPEYPREALVNRIEGSVLVQCLITADGVLRDCRILKGHPFLDPAVQALLPKQRYRPLLYGGRPVNVRYNLTFKFKLQ